jgi:hypothetical protein
MWSAWSPMESVGQIENPDIRAQIKWHDPANLSCKYKRAMAVQGARDQAKQLRSINELATDGKPLVSIGKLESAPRPCFGFGTPGTL